MRIDGEAQSGSGVLADYVEMLWLTPAMDGLFTGSGSDRRRFLDRLTLCFDPGYRTRITATSSGPCSSATACSPTTSARASRFQGLEAGHGGDRRRGGGGAARSGCGAWARIIGERKARDPNSAFPVVRRSQSRAVSKTIWRACRRSRRRTPMPRVLRETRERDRGAGRTLDGPHRSDLIVGHGPKHMAARLCSTGEQKALLLGLVLAHAELLTARQEGAAPILLLDEITAHLDEHRRAALFDEILRLKAQAWMTGTDANAFDALRGRAQFWAVEEGKVARRVTGLGPSGKPSQSS